MSNSTKIVIGVVCVLVIGLGVYFGISNKTKEVSSNNIQANNQDIFDVLNDTNKVDDTNTTNDINNTVENEISNNTVEDNNEEQPNTQNSSNTNANKEVEGKEEKESKNEQTEENQEEIAIKLAKEEWKIDVNSFEFKANKISNDIYEVQVINNTNRVTQAVYTINVKTGTVTD